MLTGYIVTGKLLVTRLKAHNKIKTNIKQWHLCPHTTGKINGIKKKKTILEGSLRLSYLGQTDGSVDKAACC